MDDAVSHRPAPRPLIDPFGRRITYLRLSVTDRCDLRCVYCMAEDQDFLPKSQVLSLEELADVARAFVRRGVRKIRLTGGEPLVRKNIMSLVDALGRELEAGGLDELTLTTNATQMARFADDLAAAGVRRVNVSLDTRDPAAYAELTRGGDLAKALAGIDAAQAAGIRVKLNAVALAGTNEDELEDLIAWAHGSDMDVTLIEVMPLGEIGANRPDQFLSLAAVREKLERRWSLTDLDETTGGPARYVRVAETGGKLGFITPLTQNFCAGCNRVRVTCTGELFMCLGRMGSVDLRAPLRDGGPAALDAALEAAIAKKPEAHDFRIGRGIAPEVTRPMSTTGG
jgi:cyclic pyranopterin phosphate synthase